MADRPRCNCGEEMRTRSSRSIGEEQLRYMRCPKCGARCRCVVKTTHSAITVCKARRG